MRRFALVIFAVVGLIFAASLGLLLAMKRAHDGAKHFAGTSSARSTDPLKPDENAKDLSIPAFTLTDQDGKPITNDIFAGKVTIVDFYFTHCKLICPALVQHMQDQQRALKETNVRLLSISVDPEHDAPAVIKQYAAEHNADSTRWTFATGERATIGRIIQEGLQFLVGEDTSEKNVIDLGAGAKMNNILHPSWFVLVGPKGEVLGFYLAEMDEDMAALTERARAVSAKLGR